ncbi:MAG TPA: phosphate transport system regulatory protein PhoU [Firmicutes bacterium]|jgi:phosphate transport system protein|nr:phosphate transport system regulatory protein PhoU [Bacillota bacterium]
MRRRAYETELEALNQDILRMGSMVENAVRASVEALARQDLEQARMVIDDDAAIDGMERGVEQRCVNLLALQQPMARDLRLVATAISIVTDLERMGDHAVNISEVTARIGVQPLIKPLIDIPGMAALSQKMIKGSLDAFVSRDAELARATCRKDDAVDSMYEALFDELMGFIVASRDESVSTQAVNLLFVARFLERIADHAANIGERVIYMVTGRRETY